ncbi:ribonuclease H-like domain-containing protein [Tanacetum coccineum]
MSFVAMADEITLESLTEEQFECFIEYYHENYPKDFKSDLKNLEEIYKMMNVGVEYPRTQNTSPSEIKEPYEPSPRMYSYEQPLCLGSTFVGVSTEDANKKFLRSLPSTWSQVSLIIRTKPGVDSLSFDDLYNNLRVFESDVKGSIASSSSTQNVAFVLENTSSTNDVSTAYGVSNSSDSSGIKIVGGEMLRSGKQEDSKALVTLDGEGVDWTGHSEDEQENYALMAYSNSGSDTEAYTQALMKVEAQLVAHQQSQLCQMSARDKAGLGYGDQMNKGVLSYELKFFAKCVLSVDKLISKIVMRLTINIWCQSNTKPSEYDARSSDFNFYESNPSEDIHESMPEPVVNEPKVVSQPKVWSDAPIIEEYESDSEDERVSPPTKEQETPNCDFHEKRMAKQAELNNRMCKGSGQRENRPVWNNVQRVNHQNQFVPKAVLTRTGKIQVNTARTSGTNTVNTARHNFNRQAVPTNAARKVNTVKPIVNNARPKAGFHKTFSPFRKPFNNTTTLRTNFSYQKVNTTENYPQRALQNKEIVDNRCFRHMIGNKAYLAEYQDFNGGPVAFGGSKGYITMRDKKNKVLFIDTECLVLSPDFKLPDENQVLPRVPRQNNMYKLNLENIVPTRGLTCLIAKATVDESNKWHRRLGHVNFKNLNKLVKGNLLFINMSFVIHGVDEITLESLTEEQFECFIEYYHENYPEDFKSDLENLEEIYKMMNGGVEYPRTQNASPSEIKEPYEPSPRMYSYEQPSCLGSTFVGETLRKSDQLHQTFEKSSIAMTHKLDDMIELPKSQPKRTYNKDLEYEIVMVKMPKCMAWLDDEPIGDLDTMEDKVDNLSPQCTLQVLPLIELYTPPVTHPEEVEETIGTPMEVEPLDHMKLEDLGLNTNTHDLFLSSKGFPSVDEPEPQLLLNFSPLDVNIGDKRPTHPSTHIVRVV